MPESATLDREAVIADLARRVMAFDVNALMEIRKLPRLDQIVCFRLAGDYWNAAELIAAELQDGKRIDRLAAQIGDTQTHVRQARKAWRLYGSTSPDQRPAYRDAYMERINKEEKVTVPPQRPPYIERRERELADDEDVRSRMMAPAPARPSRPAPRVHEKMRRAVVEANRAVSAALGTVTPDLVAADDESFDGGTYKSIMRLERTLQEFRAEWRATRQELKEKGADQ